MLILLITYGTGEKSGHDPQCEIRADGIHIYRAHQVRLGGQVWLNFVNSC